MDLIWLWITSVKGPKNQVDFLKVLYVVVMDWAGSFGILWGCHYKIDHFLAYRTIAFYTTLNSELIPIGSQKSRPVHITGPSKDDI